MANIKKFLIKYQKYIVIFVLLFLFFYLRGIITWITEKFSNLRSKDIAKIDSGVLTDSLAKTYANQLYNAMSVFGTDEGVIQSIYLKLKDMPEQVYKVYNYFGTPKYFWFGRTYFLGDEKNLWGWLLSELPSNSAVLKNWRGLLEEGNLL